MPYKASTKPDPRAVGRIEPSPGSRADENRAGEQSTGTHRQKALSTHLQEHRPEPRDGAVREGWRGDPVHAE